MKTKFPNWGYIHYRLVKDYETKFDLTNYSFTNFNKQFNKLKETINTPYNLLENSKSILSSFNHKLDPSNNYNHIPEETVNKLVTTSNQFVTTKNIHTQEYVYSNIFDILGTNKKKLSPQVN